MAALAGMMGSGGSVEGQLKARWRSWASVLRLEGRAKFPELTSARGENGSRATSRRDTGWWERERRRPGPVWAAGFQGLVGLGLVWCGFGFFFSFFYSIFFF